MKIFKLLFLFILFPLHITAKEIPLTDGWLLKGKYNATVPSTIMGVLTANGEYPGILEGLSYKDIDRTRFDQSFIYSKEFELTTEDLKENIFLQLDGISYRANIYLNGKLVADKNTIYGAYRRHTLDITKYAQATNKLEIEVFRAQKGEPNAGYVDWNPRPADESMGLFRPVSIHTCGDVLVQNLGVSSQVNTSTLKEAWLQVSADVTNMTDHPIQGKIVGKFDGKTFTYPIALTAREKKTIRLNTDMVPDLHVIEPRLWWCR
jgi:exo-1,4-beta-D-glucosaminidase